MGIIHQPRLSVIYLVYVLYLSVIKSNDVKQQILLDSGRWAATKQTHYSIPTLTHLIQRVSVWTRVCSSFYEMATFCELFSLEQDCKQNISSERSRLGKQHPKFIVVWKECSYICNECLCTRLWTRTDYSRWYRLKIRSWCGKLYDAVWHLWWSSIVIFLLYASQYSLSLTGGRSVKSACWLMPCWVRSLEDYSYELVDVAATWPQVFDRFSVQGRQVGWETLYWGSNSF